VIRRRRRDLERTLAEQAHTIRILADRIGEPLPQEQVRKERKQREPFTATPEQLPE
jgi:hypothetical protein